MDERTEEEYKKEISGLRHEIEDIILALEIKSNTLDSLLKEFCSLQGLLERWWRWSEANAQNSHDLTRITRQTKVLLGFGEYDDGQPR